MSDCPKCGYDYPDGCCASCDYKHPMNEWISVKDRKPTESDSPILALDSFEHFSTKALHYIEGWDGKGWYDASEEYGMGLNEDEAHFHEYGGMLYWMSLPELQKNKKNHMCNNGKWFVIRNGDTMVATNAPDGIFYINCNFCPVCGEKA